MNILFSGIIIAIICSVPLFAFGQDPVAEPRGNLHNREAIELTMTERELVLSEMRIFLESTQKIVIGIAGENMEMAAESARELVLLHK